MIDTNIVSVPTRGLFKDKSGKDIHAHGGCMIQVGNDYYWFGENRNDDDTFYAVSCYRSSDLKNWEFQNHVLTQESDSELNSCKIERPKVIYNANTRQFVMWMHKENATDYEQARAAVAICDSVDGNYIWKGSFRPLDSCMSRDCTLFKDDDGTAYFISAANHNADLHVYALTPDYLEIDQLVTVLWAGQSREAPALFKRDGYYYLLSSGCTGWTPNQQKYAYSQSIASEWSDLMDIGDEHGYGSQTAFVMPVQGSQTTSYLYMGDIWAGEWGEIVNRSSYCWLLLKFSSATQLELDDRIGLAIDSATGVITELESMEG